MINQRLAISWLRTWDWTKILLEYQRVCRPGGIIRITENNAVETNSAALTKLWDIVIPTFFRSGHVFTPTRDGLTSQLERLMTQHGIQNVQTRVHNLIYRADTETGKYFYEDMVRLFRVTLPFAQKWTRIPSDYEQTYQQALKEMQRPDFVATWTHVTVWGIRPEGPIPMMRGLN